VEDLVGQMNLTRVRFGTSCVPTAKWKVFRHCNYTCGYCSTRDEATWPPRGTNPAVLAALVDAFVPRSWRIYLTGGEPTREPGALTTIIRTLASSGHELRLISNGSAEPAAYSRLHDAADGALRSLFLTWHPTMVRRADFVNKALSVRRTLSSACKIQARQVVAPNLKSLTDFLVMRDRLSSAGVETKPLFLVLKTDGGRRQVDYQALPAALVADVFAGQPNSPCRAGTYCPAGYEYTYISPEMDVYTCIPAKKQADGCLGNLVLGTARLRDVPRLCAIDYCHCVPGS